MQYASGFAGKSGLEENFFAITSIPAHDFVFEAEQLMARYQQEMTCRHCGGDTEIFLRFHLSDIVNQAPLLRRILGECHGFVSFVGQPPTDGARLALEAWHCRCNDTVPRRTGGGDSLNLTLENYRLFYCRPPDTAAAGSHAQTHDAFETLRREVESRGGTLAGNCIRTWLYCRDIDNNYTGLVEARKTLFAAHGMTPTTHYIASTGIEGQGEAPASLVHMDACCLFGQRPEQIEYLQALDHLPPTHRYGVTFERGVRVIFGDRSHYYLSGTASIDRDGYIVHPDNVAAQTVRMIENVAALLGNHQGCLNDLKSAAVYLRDAADAPIVERQLRQLLPASLPRLMLKAPVCRPGWLVEMDALAVNAQGNPAFEIFR